MSALLQPETPEELAQAVRSVPRVIPVGGGTKPRLSAVPAVPLSTARLRGMVEYDPAEFTFTARAGTPLAEVRDHLAREGQYLPFDPPWVESGATLGGAVAAGLGGPGRLRYGGVRDFILGVRLVDGMGRLLRLGGKVVKNAAGFDLPKFLVGSLGRFGVLAEVTFKVFPRPPARLTARVRTRSLEESLARIPELFRTRVEPDAIEVLPGGRDLLLRLAGPETALPGLMAEWTAGLEAEVIPDADALWRELLEFSWVRPASVLVRVPVSLARIPSLTEALESLPDAVHQWGGGGAVAFIALPPGASVDRLGTALTRRGLSGLTLRGDAPLWIGARPIQAVEAAVREALDPDRRFPELSD